MILIDTSVWIDHFQDSATNEVIALREFISRDEDLCICGPILTEVLQGIRHDIEYLRTRRYFEPLIYLPLERKAYLKAAEIYRTIRKKGKTVRNTVDCLIAACAITHSVTLLHKDADFTTIAEHSVLKLFRG